MIRLLNYSHPITDAQHADLEDRLEEIAITRIPCHLDINSDFAPQIVALVDAAGLDPDDWQTTPLLLNVPALSTAAVLLLAEIHGRAGYYPPVLRLRKADGVTPPRFDVAEILEVDQQRQSARGRR